MSDNNPITDPHDPRLLAELKKKQAAEAKAKAADAKKHNMDGKGRWSGGSPVDVAKNLKSAANKAKVEHGVQTPRSPFISAWDATKKVWDITGANQNLRSMENAADRSKIDYDKAVKEWTSNPTTETYNAWQKAGHYLHTDHLNLVKAKQELDAAHAKQPRPAPDQISHVGFDFTQAGTGQNQKDVTVNDFGTAYKQKDGSLLVFGNDGNQYTVDNTGKTIAATDKNGNAIPVPKARIDTKPKPGAKPNDTGKTSPAPVGGGTGGTSATGGNTYVTVAAPKAAPEKPKSQADWAKDYGVQAGLVDSVPELKELFNNAVATKMSPEDFKAKFINSKWYLAHNDAWRVAYGAEKTDPPSWAHETNLASQLVRSTAMDTGVKLTDDQVSGLAKQALYLSAGSSSRIDTSMLKKHIVGTGIITGTTGEALTAIDDLKAHGADMGVQHDDVWYTNAAQNILHGDGNLNGWKKQINDIAKTKYSWASDQIDKGMTVKAIASPYINSMSRILEIPDGNIGLNDQTINKALTNIDQTGKQTAVPLWQFETSLRKDSRWASTKNARDTVDSTARKILSDFGLVS
jgi:hypothetical protein